MLIRVPDYLKKESKEEIASYILEKINDVPLIDNELNEIFNFQNWGWNVSYVSELADILNDLEENEYIVWSSDQAILGYKKSVEDFEISDIDCGYREYPDKNGITKICVKADCSITKTWGEENKEFPTESSYYWENDEKIDEDLLIEAKNYFERKFPDSTFEFETEYLRKDWGDQFFVELTLSVTEETKKYIDPDSQDEATIEVTNYFSFDSDLEIKIVKGKPTTEFIAYVLDQHGYDKDDWDFEIDGDSIDYFWKE